MQAYTMAMLAARWMLINKKAGPVKHIESTHLNN